MFAFFVVVCKYSVTLNCVIGEELLKHLAGKQLLQKLILMSVGAKGLFKSSPKYILCTKTRVMVILSQEYQGSFIVVNFTEGMGNNWERGWRKPQGQKI